MPMMNRGIAQRELIEKQVADIRKSVECENYLAGLALALTIPDVFGKVLHADLKYPDGRRNVGAQYATWFDEWVAHDYIMPSIENRDDIIAYFTGKMCYSLRCAYLHSGEPVIKCKPEDEAENVEYAYEFELAIGACDMTGERTTSDEPGKVTKCIRIDIGKLCKTMSDAAEKCLAKKPEAFNDHINDVLDLPAIVTLLQWS